MNINELREMAGKSWKSWFSNRKDTFLPPEAKFVTGVARHDAFLHHMLVEHGVEMILTQLSVSSWQLVDYRVVDEKKFMWFALKWS